MPKTIVKHRYEDIDLGNFEREKDIEQYVYSNIYDIWKAVFGEKVLKAEKQKYIQTGTIELPTGQVLPKRGPRVDLYVECESGNNYLVELKNPKAGNYGVIKAIGQILHYSVRFKGANKLVIMSTLYDEGFVETIKKYKLPIKFVLISKDKMYLLKE